MPPACEPRRSYRSSSPISIVTGWSSGSSRARARRIGMSFSRRSCSRYCMNGGALRARRAGCLPLSRGCFPATAGSIRVRASCIASFAWQPGVPASPSVSAFIRCGTALPPISWSKRPIFGPARSTSCGRCPADAAVITAVGRGWRTSSAIAGRLGVPPMPAMSASTNSRSCRRSSSCRTWAFSPRARPVGALGGHVERCEACAHLRISYNSCRDRHCPKCQAAAAKEWLADRQAELLPVPYFHVVFTLPRPIADIAYHNQAVVYDLLLKVAAETLITIAPTGQARGLKAHDPKHLGARIGLTAVLHTWGSTLTHHPHAHIIVPGGGVSPDGERWIACRGGFFLPVPVLSRLFRRLFLEGLNAAYQAE